MSELTLAEHFKLPVLKDINQEHTILVVEDQQDMRLIIAHHLNKLGFKNVHQSGNGMEAIHFIQDYEGKISAIVSDLEMPMMGGVDLLQELRENPKLERGPFVLTMDNPSKEKIMYAMENGVDGFLVKPFTLNDIVPKIRHAFKTFHNPKNPEKVYELAKSLYRQGQLQNAEKVYKVITEHVDTAARPWVGLSRIYLQNKDHEQALKCLDEAETRNPNYVHTFATRGEVLAETGNISDAIESFKKAIELSPLNPIRYDTIAKLLFDMNRFQETIEILTLAESNGLNFPSMHHYLSQAYLAVKDFKKATRHIRSAVNAEPENITYLNQLGICYKEQSMYDEAAKVYNSVIKIDPNNKAALYNKAVLLHAKNDVSEAVKILERLLKKHPDFDQAKRKLAEYQQGKGAA